MHRRLALAVPLLAACAATSATSEAPPGEVSVVSVTPPPAPRKVAVAAGIFSVDLGEPSPSSLYTEVAVPSAELAACLDAERDTASVWLAGPLAGGRLSVVRALGASDAPELTACVASAIERAVPKGATSAQAIVADVRLRLEGAPCAGPFCPPAPPTKTAASEPEDPWADEGAGEGEGAYGVGGLGMTGSGASAGGATIGLGSLGSLGTGTGTGTGYGIGRLGGAHRENPPSIRIGALKVKGKLPPEVIQRIVRQNFGRLRLCYEGGLAKDPKLAGKVVTSFVIGRDGAVSSVGPDKTTDLPDSAVVSCVMKVFYGLKFPQPEAGIVRVEYPMTFAPAAAAKPATVGGKKVHELTAEDLSKALEARGLTAVAVPAPTGAGFAVFARKDDATGLFVRRATPSGSGVVAGDDGASLESAWLGDGGVAISLSELLDP